MADEAGDGTATAAHAEDGGGAGGKRQGELGNGAAPAANEAGAEADTAAHAEGSEDAGDEQPDELGDGADLVQRTANCSQASSRAATSSRAASARDIGVERCGLAAGRRPPRREQPRRDELPGGGLRLRGGDREWRKRVDHNAG